MFNRILMIGMILMICGSMLAAQAELIEQRQNSITQSYREAFANSRNLLRGSQGYVTRESIVDYQIIQVPDWDEQEEWVNDEKIQYYYDNSGRLEKVTYTFWYEEEEFEDWFMPFFIISIDWMRNGLVSSVTLSVLDFWSEEIEYVDVMIWEHQYNDDDLIDVVLMMGYDEEEEEWIEEGFISFTYDEENMVSSILFLNPNDEEPSRENEYWRVEILYDENGRIATIFDQQEIDEEWVTSAKSVIEYHHSDNTTYEDVQFFFNRFSLFMTTDIPGTYDSFGKLESETYYYLEDEEWWVEDRDIFLYNNFDLLIKREWQEYDYDEEEWIANDRSFLTYDENLLLLEVLEQWADWDNPEIWHNDQKIFFFYKEVTKADEVALNPFVLTAVNYPNPFNPQTTIAFNLPAGQQVKIDVYNAKGQLIRTAADDFYATGNHHVIWNGQDNNGKELSSGVYFYRIETETDSISGKMLMLK